MHRALSGLLLASVCTTSVAASTMLRARGEFSSLFGNLEYDPSSDCTKPRRPFSGSDQFAWDLYKRQAGQYVDCMKSAAESDMEYATGVIQDGYQEKMEEFLQEIKRGY